MYTLRLLYLIALGGGVDGPVGATITVNASNALAQSPVAQLTLTTVAASG